MFTRFNAQAIIWRLPSSGKFSFFKDSIRLKFSLCDFTIVNSESNRVTCAGSKYRLKVSYQCPTNRDSFQSPIMLTP